MRRQYKTSRAATRETAGPAGQQSASPQETPEKATLLGAISPAVATDQPDPQQDPIGAFAAGQRRPATRAAYLSNATDFFGGLPTKAELDIFFNYGKAEMNARLARYEKHLRRRGLKYKTIKDRLDTLRSFLKWAHKHGLSKTDGHDVMRGPSRMKVRSTPALDRDLKAKLLNKPDTLTLAGQRDWCLLDLTITSALSSSQICALNVGDYSAANSRLRLRAEILQGLQGQVIAGHLDSRSVDLHLSPMTVTAINDYVEAAGHGRNAKNPLFRNLDRRRLGPGGAPKGGTMEDERLTVDGLSYIIRRYGRAVGITSLTGRQLRRTAIMSTLEATGGNVQEAHKFLPHLSEDTLRRYVPKGNP